MQYISHYISPVGALLLSADGTGLNGLWFEGQKYFPSCLGTVSAEQESVVLRQAKRWLDVYFSGEDPDFEVPLHYIGSDFQKEVWRILCAIPYGQTVTYGQIAAQLAKEKGLKHMSAQAVGGAVSRNRISILVPCHRVVGANGNLTGYAGGLDKKLGLLTLEKADLRGFVLPDL